MGMARPHHRGGKLGGKGIRGRARPGGRHSRTGSKAEGERPPSLWPLCRTVRAVAAAVAASDCLSEKRAGPE